MAGYLSRTQGRGLGERDGLHPSGDRARLPNRLFLFGFSAKPAHEEHRNPASYRRLAPLPCPLPFSLLHPREGFDGAVAPGFGESFAFADAVVVIELEQFHCALANRIRRVDANTIQHKAAAPAVRARVKQAEKLGRLTNEGADVAPLGVVAAGTGPREVAQIRRSAVFAADDVVRLTAPEGVVLVDEADR